MNWQKFFFYDVRSRVSGNPDKSDAGKGQWEMVEKDEEVELSDEKVIGKKSVLVFWKAKGSSLAKTKWVMHEFRLALKSNPSKVNNIYNSIHPPPPPFGFLSHLTFMFDV